MRLPSPNLNAFWASLIVEELVRNGIDFFCLAPGSRCTPLTVAVAQHKTARRSIHHDERGVAFHALGYGRATGRPAVVVTTSGTAVANTMPAVVEAAMEHVPLLLLTADRPPELRDTGANQTIRQTKIFGDYVSWFMDLPCPDERIPAATVLTAVDQAVYRTRCMPGGVVHLNCMLREPLAPVPDPGGVYEALTPVQDWMACDAPYTRYALPERNAPAEAISRVADLLNRTQHGVLVVGGLQGDSDREAVAEMAGRLQWPVCADITSGLRLGDASGLVVPFADIILGSRAFLQRHRPETVLHVGRRLVSKQLAAYLSNSRPAHYVLITDHPERQDPGHQVSTRLEGDVAKICGRLAKGLKTRGTPPWLTSWQKAIKVAEAALRPLDSLDDLNEPIVAAMISRKIPADHALFLASSMPIRDMDIFGDIRGPAVRVGANRGASGVDGTIASAAGFAQGLRRPVTLLCGDLAFLHDLNALNYLRDAAYPVIAVVINNNGGGIFSFLPIAQFEEVFEPYFITPHGLTFESVAAMYDLAYYQPATRDEFASSYQDALHAGRSAVVEVRLDREKNHAFHMQLVRQIRKGLGDPNPGGGRADVLLYFKRPPTKQIR
ncbi:MAG: 2-succinyl-5-enolpyruvyl-6-hydroxy-3-cyclohexene-1-carboxylic-acid synthase [Deltaproteobacteria bacterium]|nr:2-succinyl-5-enolpyruvyl-6-hydroxy-3-cyclohexene-1-carboxylic-acid synthase [Deltaproteobacteria bacterium]